MLQIWFHLLMAAFSILFTLIHLSCCMFTRVSKIKGQDAILIFPYPCNSIEVTLQQNTGAPFYISRHGPSLSLSQDQVHRFQVQNRTENGSCFLDLTISDLMRSDQGTYILYTFRPGGTFEYDTQNIRLVVDYPPGKATCVVGKDRGEDQVSIDCTANAGSLPGEIKCYQNGELMPSLTNPTIVDAILKETIGINKSQPTFCCSSLLSEYKERCDCNDTGLYLSSGSSNDPCPDPLEIKIHHLPITIETNQSNHYFTVTSSIPTIKENKTKQVIITTLIPFIGVNIILSFGYLYYKMKTKSKITNATENLHKNLYNL